jgi:hypothetical protein
LRWTGHEAFTEYNKNVFMVLVGKLEGNRPLARCRRKREFNIKMEFRLIGRDGVDWIYLAQDRGLFL